MNWNVRKRVAPSRMGCSETVDRALQSYSFAKIVTGNIFILHLNHCLLEYRNDVIRLCRHFRSNTDSCYSKISLGIDQCLKVCLLFVVTGVCPSV